MEEEDDDDDDDEEESKMKQNEKAKSKEDKKADPDVARIDAIKVTCHNKSAIAVMFTYLIYYWHIPLHPPLQDYVLIMFSHASFFIHSWWLCRLMRLSSYGTLRSINGIMLGDKWKHYKCSKSEIKKQDMLETLLQSGSICGKKNG